MFAALCRRQKHRPMRHPCVAVIFGQGEPTNPTFRNGHVTDSTRPTARPLPEDLRPQIPLTRTPPKPQHRVQEKQGYEADDIIATLAVQARARVGAAPSISSDKDLMQLSARSTRRKMLDAMKATKASNRDGVFEKGCVFPTVWVDLQALAGDFRR